MLLLQARAKINNLDPGPAQRTSIAEIIQRLRTYDPSKLFDYLNISKSQAISYPEFELGLDLIVPDVLLAYVQSRCSPFKLEIASSHY